ncbi:hypothetical protein CEUSTIGMA_g5094.t1 [Chlamydomonas eustigma]|uniref:Glutamyl-tRNA(Gln) amidotransferase subunit B, chloroplastic/mitochondrial n=1 Tax=Chlamydomonas eustigma TaxID=1157962 RepID=A0A250X3L6_9CHLO|nr:hypothetical protein CEUSTIGMA_g5094.t1 [Chlamydomonas eustigma]|eukprot:GAX77651.1 hypothetical protein CEUSTIGMA_g5094.t1 [Chlamydomonas eustigma]
MQSALRSVGQTAAKARSLSQCKLGYSSGRPSPESIGLLSSTLTSYAHFTSRFTVKSIATASEAEVSNASTSASQVEYEAVIGIETHVQLQTRSKAFCSCPSEYGAEPNTNICPVCMGHPGSLPVVNTQMATLAIRAGLALNSNIAKRSKFDRKQYFYPDLPKGYQISQYDEPVCTNGHIEVQLSDGSKQKFGVIRAHLEEDAGKTVYGGADRLAGSEYSLVDYNRAGVPLLEIVSSPDMRTGKDVYAYGAELRRIVRFLGISDGNMAEGSMRCDVNISVRPKGSSTFGTKVEIKNMNNLSNMQKAIEYEFDRQVSLVKSGQEAEIVQETRLWDEFKLKTTSMRKKEGLADYRYFPEPDLLPLEISEEMIEAVKSSMPELPSAKRERYSALGLPMYDVLILADDVVTAKMFDDVIATGVAPKTASNWIMGDIMAYCNERKMGMDQLKIAPSALAEMISLIETNVISGKIAKDILPELLEGKGNAGVKAFVESKGLLMISDEAAISSMVAAVLAANLKELTDYRNGKTKLQGFFQGAVMKESKGRVNPQMMQQILMKMLKGE